MQGWVVAAVWAGVVVLSAIVLGFTVYEVSWKSKRLAADRRKLLMLSQQFAELGADPTRRDGA